MSEVETDPVEPQTEPTEPEPEPSEPTTEPEPDPDAEPDAEPEPEPDAESSPVEPEPAGGLSPEAFEKAYKRVERSFSTYERTMRDAWAHEQEHIVECPLCPGKHKGFVDVTDAGLVPDEIKRVVMTFLGLAREVEYPKSPNHRTCPDCEGLGKVNTGSKVPGKETIGCSSCHGQGFIGPQVAPQNGRTDEHPGMTGPLYAPDPPSHDEVDEWKEPRILPDGRENPNFGKMPNRKIPVEPWGVTAGLNVFDQVPETA